LFKVCGLVDNQQLDRPKETLARRSRAEPGHGRVRLHRMNADESVGPEQYDVDIVVLSVSEKDARTIWPPANSIVWSWEWLPLAFPRARILLISILLGDDLAYLAAELESTALQALEVLRSATLPSVSL
jgi:hypothetical protein